MRRGAVISIPGMGYTSMARCTPRFLSELFYYSPRGVMHFTPPRNAEEAWRRTFGGAAEAVRPLGVELVLINPPEGRGRPLQEELQLVESKIRESLGRALPAASLNYFAYKEVPASCEEVRSVDDALARLFQQLDEYMIITPFGDRQDGDFEEYGIYLSSVERPGHEEVIEPEQIPMLMAELAARLGARRAAQRY